MRILRNIPIKRKLTILTMLTSGVALLLACIAFVLYEQVTFRRAMAAELSMVTDLLDDNLAPGLTFNDSKSLEITLNALNASPHILAAVVYDNAGKTVAFYQRADLKKPFVFPPARDTGTHFEKDYLEAFRRVILAGETTGTIYIASDLRALTTRLWRYGLIVSLVLLLSSLVAFALSAKLQRIISDPISHLAEIASTVATDKNYSIRATKHGEDEMGRLIDGFNEMLTQIQARDGQLQCAQDLLEKRVEERTGELQQEVAGHKRSAQALYETNQRFEIVTRATTDVIWDWNLGSNDLWWNENFHTVFGYPTDEVGTIAESWTSRIHPADAPAVMHSIHDVIGGGGHLWSGEYRFRRHDGSYAFVFDRGYVLHNEQGQPIRMIGAMQDITERKRSELELAHQRHLLQSLMDHSPDHIYFKDLDSRFLNCSEFLAIKLGLKGRAEANGKSDFDFFDEEHARRAFEDEQEIIRTGQPLLNKIEKELWTASGKIAWSLTTKMPLRNPAGEIVGTFGISKNITEQKNKEEELRRTQAFLNSVVENLPIGVFIKEAKELRFVLWSKGNEELIGISRAEILGKNDRDFFTEEQAAAFVATDRETLAQGHVVNVTEESVQTRHQGERTFLTRKVPILDEDGQPAYLLGISEDITERKRTEEARHQSESQFRQVWNASADGMRLTDREGLVLMVNDAYCRIVGKAKAELEGHSLSIIHDAGERERVLSKHREQLDSIAIPALMEKEITLWDGRKMWIDLSNSLLQRPGQPPLLLSIFHDISKRKLAETELEQTHRQLLDTSRQAGMAEVATSVLHNVGNVLNSVNVSATLVAEQLKKSKVANLSKIVGLFEEHAPELGAYLTNDPKGRQLPGYLTQLSQHLVAEQATFLTEMNELRTNIEHIKEIVSMQQSYARVSGVTETLQINDLVEDALRMNAGALVRHEVKVIREYEEFPPVTIDKHKVLQVLVNLIRNAKYACDESGRSDKQMRVRVANGDGRIKISIIDNGVGIPAENLVRIFNHGFTTRKEGHGFGLHSGALAAKELGGALSVQSEGLGKGATFTLELPGEQEFSAKRSTT